MVVVERGGCSGAEKPQPALALTDTWPWGAARSSAAPWSSDLLVSVWDRSGLSSVAVVGVTRLHGQSPAHPVLVRSTVMCSGSL